MAKVRLCGFVSYSGVDVGLVEAFLRLMQPRCAILRNIGIDTWWDRKILVGKPWEPEISGAMATSDFGLLCLSPAFLANVYVRRVELPALLAGGRMVVPVGIEPVDLKRADLRGVENLQIFRYRAPGGGARKCFSECGPVNRARFCDQLVGEMVDRFLGERA